MNHAVALVQAYLRVNGYFTVAEYPVVEVLPTGQHRTATDIDILAHRFPDSGRLVPSRGDPAGDTGIARPDPALSITAADDDMLIGEVKEGEAHLNRSATNPHVLRAALTRFGGLPAENAADMIDELIATGATTGPRGRIRLVAFGSAYPERTPDRPYEIILLGHILNFLNQYILDHWDVLSAAQFSDPAFGFLMTQEKARRHA